MKAPPRPVTRPDAIPEGPCLAAAPVSDHSVLFEIIRTPDGWKIHEDGRFHGAYAKEDQALGAAGAAATMLTNAGGKAEISYGPVHRGKRP